MLPRSLVALQVHETNFIFGPSNCCGYDDGLRL